MALYSSATKTKEADGAVSTKTLLQITQQDGRKSSKTAKIIAENNYNTLPFPEY